MKSNRTGYIYVLLAAFFFSLIAVIGKTVMNSGINVFDLLILQNAVTLIMVLAYFGATDIKRLRLDAKELKAIMIQGFIGSAATTILFYLALQRLNAGIASMLLFTHPILVSVYFMLTKTKKITLTNNLALAAAVFGCIMAINVFNIDVDKTPAVGLMIGILSSFTYAFFNIYADQKLAGYDPMVTMFYTTFVTTIVALLLRPGFFRFEFVMTTGLLFYICELAVVSGILPILFLYKGINMVGADKASIVATSELPMTLIMSFFVLGETMEMIQLSGIGLIICSIIILQYEGVVERMFGLTKDS